MRNCKKRAMPHPMTDDPHRISTAFAGGFRRFPALLWATILLFCAVLFWVGNARAASPQRFVVDSPRLESVDGTLYAACSVSVNDEDGLRDLLKDGAVLELRISFAVDRKRSWWTNAGMASGVFISGLRHDPLTREFMMTMPGDGRESLYKDRNLSRLLQTTWGKIRFPVAPERVFQEHDAPQEYLVAFTFELRHTELPPWLEKSPGFWSADVVPQERREMGFSR